MTTEKSKLVALSLMASTFVCPIKPASAEPVKAKADIKSKAATAQTLATPSKKEAKIASNSKGKGAKLLPWKALATGQEEERTYNIFKNNVSKPVANVSDPEKWRSFDPAFYANKKKLVPAAEVLAGLGPTKYPSPDFGSIQDPAKMGYLDTSRTKIVFAHQGTPLINGWIAPQAGYAYQMDGVLVYGTTDYTPVNYNGNMAKYIGVNRVPVAVLSASGTKEKLDFNRLVFPVNDNLLSKPQSIVYPSVIYLKPGESAQIQGHGTVKCPQPEQPTQITLLTPNGEQAIKIVCSPTDPVIPGKISP